MRGMERVGGWEAHYVTVDVADTLSNCEILCRPCHKKTGDNGE